MADRLAGAAQALAAARESTVQGRLRRVGIDEERLAEGTRLHDAAAAASAAAEQALDQQRAATAALNQLRQQVEHSTRDAAQLARIRLGDDHPWIEEAGARPVTGGYSLDTLLARATRFFDAAAAAPPALQQELRAIGLGDVAIQMGRGLVGGVERARAQQEQSRRRYSERVAERATAFETLDAWMREFTAVLRVALRDRPDLLARTGVRPRGRPRKPPIPRQE